MGAGGPPGQAGPWDPHTPSSQSRPKDGAAMAGGSRRSPHNRTGKHLLGFANRAGVAALFLLFNNLLYFMKTVQ